ncbi:hypothetical protein OEZ86_011048 [Tetradesmus obliquus]|nr:hypothetical protein OEZ86_011048 [Tetradesmus obliquus]
MAADRAVEFNQQLEEHRSNLTANQLKRARKKRAKLFQQALTASLAHGCQPAAKRTKFSDDEWPEPSMSSQLQDGSTCKQQQQQQQDDSLWPSSSYDAGSSHSRSMEQQQQQLQQEDSAAVQQQQQRKKQRPSFQYGNYHHYYGYRIGPSGFEDARLKVLDPSWFRGADVLDVGCNEGLLSLALAVGCCCRSMTGVDIDPALVAKACTNLSRTRSELTQQMRAAVAARWIKALTRVGFKAGNWLEQGCASNKYEVVTCFSVSKWVHLNWGDDGLMRLFHKFYRCLAPGGLLVLEPQPWKSYQAAVHKQGGTSAPFYKPEQLKLRPEGFVGFLTQRVGFELVQQLSAVSQAAGPGAVPVKGFDRPILVLRKPAALAN